MKMIYRSIILIFFTLFSLSSGCIRITQPVEVSQNSKNKRPILIINASIYNLPTDSIFSFRISQTALNDNSLNDEKYEIKDAEVTVTSNDGSIYPFTYNPKFKYKSQYTSKKFDIDPNKTYTLTVRYKGAEYTAEAKQIGKPKIDRLAIKKVDFSFEEKSIQTFQTPINQVDSDLIPYSVSISFQDKKNEDNYYFGKLFLLSPGTDPKLSNLIPRDYKPFDTSEVFSDNVQILDGNQFTIPFLNRPLLAKNQTLICFLISVSSIQGRIIDSFSPISSSPIQPRPSYPRTNIKNITNPNDPCIGYFSINNYDSLIFSRN